MNPMKVIKQFAVFPIAIKVLLSSIDERWYQYYFWKIISNKRERESNSILFAEQFLIIFRSVEQLELCVSHEYGIKIRADTKYIYWYENTPIIWYFFHMRQYLYCPSSSLPPTLTHIYIYICTFSHICIKCQEVTTAIINNIVFVSTFSDRILFVRV